MIGFADLISIRGGRERRAGCLPCPDQMPNATACVPMLSRMILISIHTRPMQTGCMVGRVFMSGSLNAAPCIVGCVAGCYAAAIGVLNDS
jgi:hypothetical protein